MADHRVVAVLGVGVVPSDTPILTADDLGAVRGDGIFETIHVRDGRAWLLDEHLARMRRSAERLELALPPTAELIELVAQCLAAWPTTEEGALRLVCTRGRESEPGGPATVFATVAGVADVSRQARETGIRVVTAPLGLPAGLRQAAPWLLGGAKTLSYAVSMASLRWALGQGADDMLWVSSDGYALEAPTSTLVWLTGTTLHTVPPDTSGILAGITARFLLDHADELGWSTAETMITPTGLMAPEVAGAWLLSSVRGVAAVRRLDGVDLAHADDNTAAVRTLLGF